MPAATVTAAARRVLLANARHIGDRRSQPPAGSQPPPMIYASRACVHASTVVRRRSIMRLCSRMLACLCSAEQPIPDDRSVPILRVWVFPFFRLRWCAHTCPGSSARDNKRATRESESSGERENSRLYAQRNASQRTEPSGRHTKTTTNITGGSTWPSRPSA